MPFVLLARVVLGRRALMRVRGVADSAGYDPLVSLPESFQQLSRPVMLLTLRSIRLPFFLS